MPPRSSHETATAVYHAAGSEARPSALPALPAYVSYAAQEWSYAALVREKDHARALRRARKARIASAA